MRTLKISLYLFIVPFLITGCDTGYQTLETGEYGVEFVKLPTFLGGGVKSNVINPGKAVLVLPWEELYRIDTTQQTIVWRGLGQGANPNIDDTVQTRTIDGNEVLLSVTVIYYIDNTKVGHIIQYVAGDKDTIMDRIRQLVSIVARSDIRAHLNTLTPTDFYKVEKTAAALEKAKAAMNARLNPEGIIIDSINYFGHKFERIGPQGIDDSYQHKIDETEVTKRAVDLERERVDTAVEQKRTVYNNLQGHVNRQNEEALGRKQQAILRGDSYFKIRELEAQRIKAVGEQEIIGLKKRIDALSGPGGEALLKLEIADALIKADPKFVVMDNQNGIAVQKLDANNLMQQIGIIDSLREEGSKEKVEAAKEAIKEAEATSNEVKAEDPLDKAVNNTLNK